MSFLIILSFLKY